MIINWEKCHRPSCPSFPAKHAVYRGWIVHNWDTFYCIYNPESSNTSRSRYYKLPTNITRHGSGQHVNCILEPGVKDFIYCTSVRLGKLDEAIDYIEQNIRHSTDDAAVMMPRM